VAFVLLGLVLFGSTSHDDSHITYWAALSLQRFGQILNYNGERVEQSSSLLHVVLLALLGTVTRLPMPTLGPLTSIAAGVVAIFLAGELGERVVPGGSRGAALLAATTSCFVCWGFGGLETTLFAAAALWVILTCSAYLEAVTGAGRGLARPAVAMLLFLCARPEAPIVLACTLAAVLVHAAHRRRAALPALRLVAVAAAETLAIFAFRRAYFGALFPNPVYTKVTGIAPLLGLRYLWEHLYPASLWVAAGVALGLFFVVRDAVQLSEPRFAAVLTAAFTVAYTGFIVLSGGDWMAGGRFIAHVVPAFAVVTALGVCRALPRPRGSHAALALCLAVNAYGIWSFADGRSNGRPLWSTRGLRAELDRRFGPRGFSFFELASKVHLRDTSTSAELVDLVGAIRAAKPDRPILIMSAQAGMVPYHAFAKHYRALRFLDTLSITTRDFLRCLPRSKLQGRGALGTQLPFERYFAEEAAIDAACGTRRPDIVFGLGHRGLEPLLERNGYTLVFRQRGSIENEGLGPFLHTHLASDELIAVDSALLAEVPYPVKPMWQWDVR
jgi:hypothetical protein